MRFGRRMRRWSMPLLLRSHLAAGLGWTLLVPAALAQTPAPAPAPSSTPAPVTPTEPYQDRVLNDLPPESLNDADAAPAYDGSGWPRFLRLETRLGTAPFDRHRSRVGVAVYGLLETPNHGTLSIDGSHSPHAGRGTLTVRQRGLPLGAGWTGNHEAGVLNSPLPPIHRLPSRVVLPSALIQGVAGEWARNDGAWQWQAASGTPGRLEGLPSSVWRSGVGQRDSLGLQWRPGVQATPADPLDRSGWTLAAQFEAARGVALGDEPLLADRFDADGTLLAARHETEDRRVQAQWVQANDGQLGGLVGGQRQGLWIDAEWDDGPRRYGAGLYRLDPDLHWAGQPMANDAQGVYVRNAWRTRQWSAEGSLDWLRSVRGDTADGVYVTLSGRRRLGTGNQIGAGAALRDFGGRAWTSYADWRRDNDWGNSGWRLDLSGGASQASEQRLGYDQDWRVPQGWSLSTSLGLGRVGAYDGQAAQDLWSAALSLSAPLGSRANLRASLDTEQRSGGEHRYSLSLGANWRINTRWSAEGQYNRSLGRSSSASIDPLAPPVSTLSSADRSFYAVLRYELQAGSRMAPLGGRPQEGGGRIEGVVYLDANRSGTQEASEQGASGVTVYLDNRYAVRTDAQGRFTFPLVAAGTRTVTVRNETLPLPWAVVDDGSVKITVRLREDTRLSIPVQRAE